VIAQWRTLRSPSPSPQTLLNMTGGSEIPSTQTHREVVFGSL
jgi:hypothetical protein